MIPALGIDVGATRTRWMWIAAGVSPRMGQLPTATPPEFGRALASIRRALPAAPKQVGLGFAGSLDASGRVQAWPNRPEFIGFPVLDTLGHAVGPCSRWADDCAAAAWGEHLARRPLHRGECLVYAGIGTGIGGGAVCNGRLHEGAAHRAFALGHLPARTAGITPCRCGRTGCLQTVASGRALDALARDRGLPPGQIAARARAHDPVALELLADAGEAIAEVLAWAARLLDPDRIVLGGGLADAGEALRGPLAASLERALGGPGAHPVALERARLGPWSGAFGAALLGCDPETLDATTVGLVEILQKLERSSVAGAAPAETLS